MFRLKVKYGEVLKISFLVFVIVFYMQHKFLKHMNSL